MMTAQSKVTAYADDANTLILATTAAMMGGTSTHAMPSPFTLSMSHRRTVCLLNPCFASMTNVAYAPHGASFTTETSVRRNTNAIEASTSLAVGVTAYVLTAAHVAHAFHTRGRSS